MLSWAKILFNGGWDTRISQIISYPFLHHLKMGGILSMNKEDVIEVLKQCNDPELDMNVWFLGLIYNIEVNDAIVKIKMTFTTPFCPYGPSMLEMIKSKLKEAGAKNVEIEIVFEPKWEPSEDVKMALGI
mgnify:CR=1 FL=1